MDSTLWTLLANTSAVTAICGEQIFWDEAPKGAALPAVILSIISDNEGLTLTGPDGLRRYRVQIDCIALNRSQARALAEQVRAVLHGYSSGPMRLISAENGRSRITDSTPTRAAVISHDFNITWRG